jgi:hypothetical protein
MYEGFNEHLIILAVAAIWGVLMWHMRKRGIA